MAKTQAERLQAIEDAQEALRNQQRILIMQNDKILEFVDALYVAMAQQAEEAPEATGPDLSAQSAMEMLKDLSGGDDGPPKASTSWGRNGGN